MKNIIISLIPLISILSVFCFSYAYFIEPDLLVVNQYEIKVKNWNPAFNGLKVALISDIHGGSNSITEEKLRKIVEQTNLQNPDLIVLIGDFISQSGEDNKNLKMSSEKIAENLKGFKGKYGVFGVLGNHDVRNDSSNIKNALTKAGIKILENELEFIRKDGQTLRIFGLKDHTYVSRWKDFADDARKVLEQNEQTGDVLVLEHSPDILPVITKENLLSKDMRLILAGHTHGGQVRFPILGSLVVPSSYGQKYVRGFVRDQEVDMFVTTGIGTSILPIRFMVPPEIAILTITGY